ncbi:hypothetical protein VC83_07205 [Pseudogymnoascus destructans]|uniref:MARVEL domain-containing protein n=2 Tax=Pseudogymnoascus destructans TaxID=655981 RepID=L8FRA2_PSED2|nr:uncharacterized protein VC83_07205 [Pseudogymnoascus destructans]ELR03432.1 hypothetical protein GMDG_06167 [Pseudogymnoascus destructans 20631-21]OAF56637.1 hypothetical protein VC83_07205 [Pseudogymnoascus destructans]
MGFFPSGGNRSRSSDGGSTGSRAASVVFRLMQLISAAIVAGLLGRYLHNVHEGGGFNNRRIIYAISIAGIAIFFSLLFMLPLKYQFYAFPFDFIMFILWMVAFGLLVNLGSSGCNSSWYRTSWSWAWGRWYRQTAGTFNRFTGAGCSSWRATLAFSFIGGIFWLLSFLLGLYFLTKHRSRREVHEEAPRIRRQEDTHVNSGIAPVYHENRNQTREYRTTPAETIQSRTEPAATYVQPPQTQGTAATTYSQPQYTTTQEYATHQYPTQQYESTPETIVGQTAQDVLSN